MPCPPADAACPARAIAINAMADSRDLPEWLDMQVEQTTGLRPLVPLHRLDRPGDGTIQPRRCSQRLTVDRGIRSARAIAHAGNACCARRRPIR
jgi:hypothetical protein